MENKKIIIGIIIICILITLLIGGTYYYIKNNEKQTQILTQESEKILQMNLATDEIDNEIKTTGKYAIVEETLKKYLTDLKKLYTEVEEINNQINPNEILSAKYVEDKEFSDVEKMIEEYQTQNKQILTKYKEMIKEEVMLKEIQDKITGFNRNYYISLYETVITNEVFRQELDMLQSQIEKQKEKNEVLLSGISDIKDFLKENIEYLKIKDGKIQITNVKKMTEYYNLLNKIGIEE